MLKKKVLQNFTILALTAIGKDVTDVASYNLLEPLADMDYVKKQGINGPIFALIALDTGDYEIPQTDAANPTTREKLVQTILDAQVANGGWTFFGSTADPDRYGNSGTCSLLLNKQRC